MEEMKAKIIEMLTELSEEMSTEDFEKLCKQDYKSASSITAEIWWRWNVGTSCSRSCSGGWRN